MTQDGLPGVPHDLSVGPVRVHRPGHGWRIRLRATWTPVPGAEHYGVSVRTEAGGTLRMRADEPAFEWSGIAGGAYRVRVCAVAPSGINGPYCEEVAAQLAAPP